MHRFIFLASVLIPISTAQAPAKFEVVSIHRLDPPLPGAPIPAECAPSNSPGRLTTCSAIVNFVSSAYGVLATGRISTVTIPAVVEGGPEWVRSDLYAINAKTAEPATQEMMRGPMMQALLEDRFKLKLHRDLRQVPVYELSVKNAARLAAHQQGNCTPFDRGQPRPSPEPGKPAVCQGASMGNGPQMSTVTGDYLPMDTLAVGLYGIRAVDRPVVNKTGLKGIFALDLRFANISPSPAAQPANDDSGLPSVFTAIEEELGLRLEPAKGPQEFLIIDRIEPPSEE